VTTPSFIGFFFSGKTKTAFRTKRTSPLKLVDCHGREMMDNRDWYPAGGANDSPLSLMDIPHAGDSGRSSPHSGSIDMW